MQTLMDRHVRRWLTVDRRSCGRSDNRAETRRDGSSSSRGGCRGTSVAAFQSTICPVPSTWPRSWREFDAAADAAAADATGALGCSRCARRCCAACLRISNSTPTARAVRCPVAEMRQKYLFAVYAVTSSTAVDCKSSQRTTPTQLPC